MKKALTAAMLILGLILLPALNSHAEPGISAIGGEYFVTGIQTCVSANDPERVFGDIFRLPESGGTIRTGYYEGTLILNGDGTGTLSYSLARYTPVLGPYQTPFTVLQTGLTVNGLLQRAPCDVLYETLPTDGSVLRIPEGCTNTTVLGPGLGNNWIYGDIFLTLKSSMNGEILLLSTTRPIVEAQAPYNDPTNIRQAVCSRTLTAVRQSAAR